MISIRARSRGLLSLIKTLHKNNQGDDAFTCWAFSCASMLRTSCLLLIRSCHSYRLIDDDKKKKCEKFIMKESVHVQIRNLTMMVLLPRKLHTDDESQGAYVQAAMARVRTCFKLLQ